MSFSKIRLNYKISDDFSWFPVISDIIKITLTNVSVSFDFGEFRWLQVNLIDSVQVTTSVFIRLYITNPQQLFKVNFNCGVHHPELISNDFTWFSSDFKCINLTSAISSDCKWIQLSKFKWTKRISLWSLGKGWWAPMSKEGERLSHISSGSESFLPGQQSTSHTDCTVSGQIVVTMLHRPVQSTSRVSRILNFKTA